MHVEAGLRTGNLQAPWPEELNRRITGMVTALHCAPTARAAENLLSEGVRADSVAITGNTVIDALMWTVNRQRGQHVPWLEKYASLGRHRMVLITGHRRENFGDGLEQICNAILMLAGGFPDVEFVYPVHLNPNVHEPVGRLLANSREYSPYRTCAVPGVCMAYGSINADPYRFRRRAGRSAFAEKTRVGNEGNHRTARSQCNPEPPGWSEPMLGKIVEQVNVLLTDPAEYASRQIARKPLWRRVFRSTNRRSYSPAKTGKPKHRPVDAVDLITCPNGRRQ